MTEKELEAYDRLTKWRRKKGAAIPADAVVTLLNYVGHEAERMQQAWDHGAAAGRARLQIEFRKLMGLKGDL